MLFRSLGRSTEPARKQQVAATLVALAERSRNGVAGDTAVGVVGDGIERQERDIHTERGEVTGEQPGIVDMPPERVAERTPSGKNSKSPAGAE